MDSPALINVRRGRSQSQAQGWGQIPNSTWKEGCSGDNNEGKLLRGVKLIKSSGNGLHYIAGDILYKVQVDDLADSIVAEAVSLRLMNKIEASKPDVQKLFPLYLGVFVMKGPITYIDTFKKQEGRVGSEDTLFRVLKMEVIGKSMSLFEYVAYFANPSPVGFNQETYSYYYQLLGTQLHDFLLQYGKLCKDGGVTHNDLGLPNILMTEGRMKVIDCGRLFIPEMKEEGFLNSPEVKDIFARLCVQESTSIFVNQFHIEGKYHHLCDLIMPCLNVLPSLSYFKWYAWCYMDEQMNLNLSFANLFSSKDEIKPEDVFAYVLAWFVCCIYAYNCCGKYLMTMATAKGVMGQQQAKKRNVTLDTMLEYFEHVNVNQRPALPLDPSILYDENVAMVLTVNVKSPFNELRNGNLLLSNSQLNPTYYHMYRNVAERLFTDLNLSDPFGGMRGGGGRGASGGRKKKSKT